MAPRRKVKRRPMKNNMEEKYRAAVVTAGMESLGISKRQRQVEAVYQILIFQLAKR